MLFLEMRSTLNAPLVEFGREVSTIRIFSPVMTFRRYKHDRRSGQVGSSVVLSQWMDYGLD